MGKRSSDVAAGSSAKRKHHTLTIKDKISLIKKLERGTAVNKLCEEFGIGKSTVYDIKKQKKELFQFFADSDTPMAMCDRKIMRQTMSDDHDRVMIEWVKQRRSEGVPLTGPLIMEQAKNFHQSMNLTTECSYTTGWLDKFKKRHGIRQLRISGDRESAYYEAAEVFVSQFLELVKEDDLSPEQIYNADETGLFWRYVPRKTLATADEKDPTGVKDSKERITIMACSNAAGTHKTKLFVFGKSAKPRAFKQVKVFPVIYRSNKKAWMTQILMNEWFENHFVPESRRHLTEVGFPPDAKIVLILDNCTAHLSPEILTKDNVSVVFLPPNVTSILQPMDQGILRSLKCAYKTQFLREMLVAINGERNIFDFLKSYNLKTAIWSIAKSWDALPAATLKNGWRNVWPATLFHGEEEDEDDFEGFQVNQQKKEIFDLLDYVKSAGGGIIEDDVLEVLNIDNVAPTVSQLTNDEIRDMVINPECTDDISDSDEESEEIEEKMSIDSLVDLLNTAIKGLEQRDFILESDIMGIHKIKERLLTNKPKLMKQLTLREMFNKK